MKVAVIGAGPSGLTSIKGCLDEGLDPTCFESSDDIGGLWRFKEKPEPGRANIYQSLIVNSSKEMMAYSDFPPPAELPNNMHHSEVMLYLRLYSQTFKLQQRIQFQTTVVGVTQRPDFAATGQWEVETERRGGQRNTDVFDAVIVCTGHYTRPHLPLQDFPGIESFEGRYFHSWEYRSAEGLEGKRVVVIGIGNSGSDIAVEVSRVAEKVYLSTRTGAWVVGRVGPGGIPGDFVGSSRLDVMLQMLFPSWTNRKFEKMLNKALDHRLYGLGPKHRFFAQIPVVNDDLPARIISGRVQLKPNVKEFCGSRVVFVDGSSIDKVDVVVFATGYNYSFPFLPPALQAKCDYRLRLYKQVFPPVLTKPTLAIVGFIHGFGAINPMAEMQARWVTRVFKGLITLPSQQSMMKEIEKDTAMMRQSYATSERNPIQVHYTPYIDSVAELVGVRPNIPWLFLTDTRLAFKVLLGPCTPYQYRLTGPGHWAGARDAILTQWERVFQPFKTRVVPEPDSRSSSTSTIILILSSAALLCCFYYKKDLSSILSAPSFLKSPQ
ncbi:dimethylaniline monooxygenase [N-oxide-forming] 5-like [Mastacembelus armatus]|uniref:Flavin-containing monooxygenase n=1 Tax=Mastacembelus armatus TaxID=205130 RepID=A0A3Q3MC19_9TELE|nr:dimethylaniline monooxygenase [N-oxide-forming] 5-like [Mastacembelus armatus]XP_026160381.1 dimethylaniline monooxygenase [N-oxide-forming] 5-like [Mastacembelus armatus]XP_026160382.1 dimethylaniline monooxygenase [N-oxide-forming] 5-like [Mastacembelus armatus]XP_026160383.1 dimethylaniline monooxygenase [N-oxide-forming] 5-like [Mastacembelus armatus]XP_033181026.1 dimethylaniline monooxygenase [N-oxide-forming] 5-like [Mastacembelus armatus]